jgi:hypothetical protein
MLRESEVGGVPLRSDEVPSRGEWPCSSYRQRHQQSVAFHATSLDTSSARLDAFWAESFLLPIMSPSSPNQGVTKQVSPHHDPHTDWRELSAITFPTDVSWRGSHSGQSEWHKALAEDAKVTMSLIVPQ